jgi:hypothetical protein
MDMKLLESDIGRMCAICDERPALERCDICGQPICRKCGGGELFDSDEACGTCKNCEERKAEGEGR